MFKPFPRKPCLFALAPLCLTLLSVNGCNRDPNVRKARYLESGKRYENDGKLKEAVIQFSNALKVDRNYADAHYELGKTYLKMGSFLPAYQEMMRTVELSPTNLRARLDTGNLELAGGLPDKAAEQAKAVLAQDPRNADAFALISQVAQKKGDHAEALSNIQKALEIEPRNATFHTNLALIQSADPQNAPVVEQELRKAVELDPTSARAHMILAIDLEKKGNKQEAEQQYIQAAAKQPKELPYATALASFYIRSGDKNKAEQTLQQATADFPDSEEGAALLNEYFLGTGQFDKIEPAYAAFADKFPKSIPIRIIYARSLLMKHQDDKARPIIEKLTKTNANDPQVQILNSMLLLNAGKLDETYDLLQKAVKGAPDNEQLQLAFGKVANAKGKPEEAAAAFREAAKLKPGDLQAQQALAETASRRGDMATLTQVAERTLALHPDAAIAYQWRATAEANQKLTEKADADFQTAQKMDPNNISLMIEYGQFKFKQGRNAEASALLEQALAKNPNAVPALSLLVQYDLSQKQPEKAVARIQAQISKAPGNAAYYTTLADLQIGAKDFNSARDNARKAMELNREDEQSVQVYTAAVNALGDRDQAIKTWQQWADNHPRDAAAVVMLAQLQEAKGDIPKAIELYKKTLELSPGQPQAANNLAYLMVENGQNVDVALSLAQTARRSLPDSPSTADTLAWVYFHKGTYSYARDLLEEAVKSNPQNASMQYHLGMTYSKLGDKANASLHLKKAVSLAPDSPVAKSASAALEQLG